MKKLLTILATLGLITSSTAGINAWKQTNQQNQQINNSQQATNEDAEDIASKLWNQAITIDANFFLSKDIKNYQSQFNAAIVKDGILTKDEVQYVSWNNLNITQAGWFWNKGAFTVQKDGATMTGQVTVDASTNETTKQIATKLETAHIQFNYNYWDNKTVTNYLTLIRSILVNEKILSKAEASEIVGFLNPVTITKAGLTTVTFNINDNNTNTYADTHVNVLDDGKSAVQLANQINSNDVFRLKTNALGKYADSNVGGVFDNIRQQLAFCYYEVYEPNEVKYIWPPHRKLQDINKNFVFTAIKDGQAVQSPPCTVVAHNYCYSSRDWYDQGELEISVNLTAHIVDLLFNYFQISAHHNYWLGYFYQILNNGQFATRSDIPSGAGIPKSFADNNRFGILMTPFWRNLWGGCKTNFAAAFANMQNDSLSFFADELFAALSDAYNNGNGLGISFDWHVDRLSVPYLKNIGIMKYSFW